MQEVIGRKLSNGINTAYFMDSIKIVDKNKLVLYSSLRPDLNDECDLPTIDDFVADNILYPIHGVYNITTQIEDQSVDCTSIVQDLIDACHKKYNGGIIRFGSGIYKISHLDLYPGISLEGNGIGSTIILRNIDVAPKSNISDPYNQALPFINIKSTDAAINIKNMTINGGVSLGVGDTIDIQTAGVTTYDDSYKINGISINNTSATAMDEDANSTNPYRLHNSTFDLISGTTPLKFVTISNVAIVGFSGSGIYIGDNNKNIILENIYCLLNRYSGIINCGENISMNNIILTGNGNHGLHNLGNYLKAINIESSYNGKYNHLDSNGILNDGNNSVFTNIIAKNNYCIAINNKGNYNSFNEIIVDANGSRSTYDPAGGMANPRDIPQVYLTGEGNKFKGGIYNYKATNNVKTASKAITSDENLSNSIIEVFISVLAGNQKSNIYSEATIDYNQYANRTDFGSNVVTVIYV